MSNYLPDSEEICNLNESDALVYINKVLDLLRNKSYLKDEYSIDDLTSRISATFFDCDDYLEKVIIAFIENGYCEVANNVFNYLVKSNKIEEECCSSLLTSLINFSDHSIRFSTNILASPLTKSLVDFCVINQSKKPTELILKVVTVIHNVLRYPANILVYESDPFKQVLIKFIKYNNTDKLGIISLLTLSYVIEEKEAHLLDEGVNAVGILINRIKTVNKVNRRSDGFSIKELLYGLRRISANENMKTKIFDENGLPLFIDILTGKYDTDEKELSLSILWNLCFNGSIKSTLQTTYKIENVISNFVNHENVDIRKNCAGILWLLEQSREPKLAAPHQSDTNMAFKFDVFISYAHEYKDTVQTIKNEIVGSNFRVWIDNEQMFGSTIQAMADGIENSRVFIVAMSKAYRESPACRSEAEYAYKLKKPIVPVVLQLKYKPTSWLSFIIGNVMYYELSERRDPRETLLSIVQSIRRILDAKNDEKVEISELIEPRLVSTVGAEKGICKGIVKGVKVWTKSEVTKWLIDAKLGSVKKHFSEVDGTLLEILVDIKEKSPEYFNETLKREFGMKFVEVLKFHKAINSLYV